MDIDGAPENFMNQRIDPRSIKAWNKLSERQRQKVIKEVTKKFQTAMRNYISDSAVTGKKAKKRKGGQQDIVLTVKDILEEVGSTEDQKQIILATFKSKDKITKEDILIDSIQLALTHECLKLFHALLIKVDARDYLNKFEILENTIMYNDDRMLEIVLRAYNKHEVRISLAGLSRESREVLFNSSWNMEIIQLLYPFANSFFIPRGQEKAKMYAFICYNTFSRPGSKHPRRQGAKDEADSIIKGLQSCGFTIRMPLVAWKFDRLLGYLRQHITDVKDNCSVIFICLMSHGDKGILYDADGSEGKINQVLEELAVLKSTTPVVLLIQACQGMNPPEQQVESEYRWSVIDGAHIDALPDQKASGYPQVEDDVNEHILALQRQIDLYKCHIKVKRPNTVVYTATADSYYATRAYFLKHLVKQLEDSDGNTTFDTMVQLCSRDMSHHPDEECRNQAPMTYGLMRQPLILPPSNAFEKKTDQTCS